MHQPLQHSLLAWSPRLRQKYLRTPLWYSQRVFKCDFQYQCAFNFKLVYTKMKPCSSVSIFYVLI